MHRPVNQTEEETSFHILGDSPDSSASKCSQTERDCHPAVYSSPGTTLQVPQVRPSKKKLYKMTKAEIGM